MYCMYWPQGNCIINLSRELVPYFSHPFIFLMKLRPLPARCLKCKIHLINSYYDRCEGKTFLQEVDRQL